MAERESTESVYCLGCGNDLKEIPTERRNLGSDSLATPEPRERVLSSWTSLLNQELQCQGTTIESYIKDPANPGRMCRKCFYDYEKYAKLYKKLVYTRQWRKLQHKHNYHL